MIVNGWLTRAQLENLSTDPTPGLLGRVFWNTALGKPRVDNGTAIQDLGGSSAGGINYITNPDAEAATTGWATYADAAGTSPVDGTGGSPAVTLTRVTTTPLRGLGMFRITKDAVNRQGNGVSYDFTIASADKAHMLGVSFEYSPSSAFVSGNSSDLNVWIYDVTNSVLIPVTPYTIQGGNGSNHKFVGQFQTSSNSKSYRLILHVATTNASAWTFDFDNVIVSPVTAIYGAPVSDWATCTVTGSWVSNTTYTALRRRVGDSEQYAVRVACTGAPTSAALTVTLPSDRAIDTTKVNTTTAGVQPLGTAQMTDASTNDYVGFVRYSSATAVDVRYFSGSTTVGANVTQAAPFTFGNGDSVDLLFTVPIAGWGSGVLMSNDTDNRVVAARYTLAGSGNVPGTATVIVFDTKSIDTHNAVASGVFTCPVSGLYRVAVSIPVSGTAINAFVVDIRKNGSDYKSVSVPQEVAASFTHTIETDTVVSCKAGDTLSAAFRETVDNSTYTGTLELCISRLSGPESIGLTETVAATYTSTASTSITGTAAIINFEGIVFDTHSAVTVGASWKFTAPVSGLYRVKAAALLTGGTNTVGGLLALNLYKNGVVFNNIHLNIMQTTQAVSPYTSGEIQIRLLAGEYVDVRCSQSTGNAFALAGTTNTYVDICRIGNY